MAGRIDPNDFLLNTDFDMDKVVWVKEGSIAIDTSAAPGSDGARYTREIISHGLPFFPLVFGFCSYEKDFSETMSFPYRKNPHMETTQGQTSLVYDCEADVVTNNSTVEVSYASREQAPGLLYYRIYGLEPSDSKAKVGATRGRAKTFILNTDNNYRKLYKKGIAMPGETTVIAHNFGYIPQCRFWFEYGGANAGLIWDYYRINGRNGQSITNDNVVITLPTGGIYQDSKVHYRIYYDKA